MYDFTEIRNLISNDELPKAIDSLIKLITNKESKDELLLQKNRLITNRKDFDKGFISSENYYVNKNRLVNTLLKFVRDNEDTSSELGLAANYHQIGMESLSKEDFDRAIDYFTKATKKNPYSADPYIDRGVAKIRIKSYLEAIIDLTTAIELSPNQPFAYHNRGIAYYQMKEYQKACNDWKTVKSLDFDISDIYINRFCNI